MAFERANTTRPAAVSRWRRVLLFIFLSLLFFSGLIVWLIGTNQGTRATFYLIGLITHERFQATEVRGSFLRQLHIGYLAVRWKTGRLAINDLQMRWQPQGLKNRLLPIESLSIKDLHFNYIASADSKAFHAPASLTLPVAITLDHFSIDRLHVSKGKQSSFIVENVQLGWDFDHQIHRLRLRSAYLPRSAAWPIPLRLTANLKFQAAAPFAMEGDIQLKGKYQDSYLEGDARINGVMSAMRLESKLEWIHHEARAMMISQFQIEALSPQIIKSGVADIAQLDLSSIHADWPKTKIYGRVNLTNEKTGRFIFENAMEGSWDKNRLPIAHASGRFTSIYPDFSLDDININHQVITGKIKKQNAQWQASLRTKRLDLKKIDSRLHATRLDGLMQFSRNHDKSKLRLDLTEAFKPRALHVHANAQWDKSLLTIAAGRLALGHATAEVQGQIDFHGTQKFNAHVGMQGLRLTDFGQFDGWPDIRLSGRFDLTGRRQPDLQMALRFSVAHSSIGQHPVLGRGDLQLDGQALTVRQLELRAGDNSLQAQGKLTHTRGDLDVTLSASNLAQLGASFGGRLEMTANIRGPLTQPMMIARWKIHALRLPGDWSAQDGQGRIQLGLTQSAPLFLQAELRHAVIAGTDLSSLNIDVDGQPEAHQLSVRLISAATQLQFSASGGLDAMNTNGTWRGHLLTARAKGMIDAVLDKSAEIEWSRQTVQIKDLRLSGNIGELVIDYFRYDPTQTLSRGEIRRLHLGRLAAAAHWTGGTESDLQLEGRWDLNAPHQDIKRAEGRITLQRLSGDLRLTGTPSIALQLQQLEARMQLQAGRLSISLDARGDHLGRLRLAGGTQLRSDQLLPDTNAPVDGVLNASLPSLSFLGPILSSNLRTGGRLDARVSVTGSLNAPTLAGTLSGEHLQMRWVDQGFNLAQGRLQADFNGNLLQVHDLSFAGSRQSTGRISVNGPIRWHEGTPVSDLRWHAAQFSPLDRRDRQLMVSGQGQLQTGARYARLTGTLQVDRGFIDLGQEGTPALSDDVIVLNKPPPPMTTLGMELALRVGLGEQLLVRGRGVDARLSGSLLIRSQAGAVPTAQGRVQVSRGIYTAYGRELAIERGVLRFDGPPGNPALDIRAMRRGTEVEAGVMITGTALAPRIRLVSEPQVPDAEKIAWLVLGQSMSATTDKQAGMLQEAAASLLTQGAAASLQSQIAGSLGLDTITLSRRPDNLEQRIITLGKRVSSRLYVSYQQGLQAAGSVILLRYTLSPRVTVEAETGTRSVFSLFYNFSFD